MSKHTKNSNFLLVALTGSFASGKSKVGNLLQSDLIAVIDADVLTRRVLNQKSAWYNQIIQIFPNIILHTDGSINRKIVAELIFNDSKLKKQLEDIIHPAVKKLFQEELNTLSLKYSIIIYQIPLLFEQQNPICIDFDLIVSVITKPEIAIERGLSRSDIDRKLINKILSTQVDNQTRIANSDYIINNNGNLAELEEQVLRLKNHLNEQLLIKQRH